MKRPFTAWDSWSISTLVALTLHHRGGRLACSFTAFLMDEQVERGVIAPETNLLFFSFKCLDGDGVRRANSAGCNGWHRGDYAHHDLLIAFGETRILGSGWKNLILFSVGISRTLRRGANYYSSLHVLGDVSEALERDAVAAVPIG